MAGRMRGVILAAMLAGPLASGCHRAVSNGKADPASSASSLAPPAVSSTVAVEVFDGGYAVGPAREVERLAASRARGTRTACEEPAPTPEERAEWKTSRTGRSRTAFVDLLAAPDLDLTTEVGSRLLDKIYSTAGFAGMSRAEQNVYLVWVLQGEVENGGLDQFFANSSGNCAVRTAKALDEIGMTEESQVYREALALFPDASPSEDRSTRFDEIEAIGARSRRWGHLDPKLEGILQGTAGYIRRHAMESDLRP